MTSDSQPEKSSEKARRDRQRTAEEDLATLRERIVALQHMEQSLAQVVSTSNERERRERQRAVERRLSEVREEIAALQHRQKFLPRDVSTTTDETTRRLIRHWRATQAQIDPELHARLKTQLDYASETQQQVQELMAALQRKEELTVEQLRSMERRLDVQYLFDKVRPEAGQLLTKGDDFKTRFDCPDGCLAAVMSVDIRRSTDLMLKASSPGDYATFMLHLCDSLFSLVTQEFGVFDKFTGDGILAFFPDFYSGSDLLVRALRASLGCHEVFQTVYTKHHSHFKAVPVEVGLGIGLDWGKVYLAHMPGGLTPIGDTVVYACRLAAAPYGVTLVNQSAYDQATEQLGDAATFEETQIEFKHEGPMVVHRLVSLNLDTSLNVPDWFAEMADATNERGRKDSPTG